MPNNRGPDIELMIDTPAGKARALLARPDGSVGLLCLGHGAGGGIEAPDLIALRDAAQGAGWAVARIEQPYRVAGRRAPAPAPRLDEAWTAVVTALHDRSPGRLVVGGRSSGARVACRTVTATRADAVVCLAFPIRPPRRPERSRLPELAGVGVPVLVVQGRRDPFGGPDDLPAAVEVVAVDDDHSLRRSARPAADAVVGWLDRFVNR